MYNKQKIQLFFKGFFSVFEFSSTKQKNNQEPIDIFVNILDTENYINIAYKNIKNDFKRNKKFF